MASNMVTLDFTLAGKAVIVVFAGLVVNFLITGYKRRHALDGLVCKLLLYESPC